MAIKNQPAILVRNENALGNEIRCADKSCKFLSRMRSLVGDRAHLRQREGAAPVPDVPALR